MASKTKALIVPFGISGKYKFRSKGLCIKIGKPINVNNLTYEEANKLLKEKIMELI